MSKLDAMTKVAVSSRFIGTAFGAALGSIPGLLEAHKLKNSNSGERSRIIGKIFLGAGIGGAVGNIGGHFFGSNKVRPELLNKNVFRESIKRVPMETSLLGAAIGAVPGAIGLAGLRHDGPDYKRERNRNLAKMLGGGALGAGIVGGSKWVNQTTNSVVL